MADCGTALYLPELQKGPLFVFRAEDEGVETTPSESPSKAPVGPRETWVPSVYWPSDPKGQGLSCEPYWKALAELDERLPWLATKSDEADKFWNVKLRLASRDNPVLGKIEDDDLRSQVALLGLAEWARRRRIENGILKDREVGIGLVIHAVKNDITERERFGQPVMPDCPFEDDVQADMAMLAAKGVETVPEMMADGEVQTGEPTVDEVLAGLSVAAAK